MFRCCAQIIVYADNTGSGMLLMIV